MVSGLTLVSRVLGLFRDILFFALFGASVYGEAFLLAFTLPNLLRRMLGEGTLSSAFIPVFSELSNKRKIEKAWELLNQVLSRLFIYVGVFSLLVVIISWLIGGSSFLVEDKWVLGFQLNALTFGYGIFICSSAIVVGALNVFGRFFEGALSPILLNTCLILALLFSGSLFLKSPREASFILACSVLVAGFVQLFIPWVSLRNKGWHWRWDGSTSSHLLHVQKLFWIGAMGAAVTQLNILISRFLAYSLEDSGALSYLYISARLVELPLGVFAIAISTVLFPQLAKAASHKVSTEFKENLLKGLKTITWITLPAAIGLSVLSKLVIGVLFEWNEFSSAHVTQAASVLTWSAWSIPLYAYTNFIVKAFHARKEMNIPFRAALISLTVNLLFSLLLLIPFGIIGLVWANIISCCVQLLYLSWKSSFWSISDWLRGDKIDFLKCSLAGLFMYFIISKIEIWEMSETVSKSVLMMNLALNILAGVIIYFFGLCILGVLRIDSLRKIISK